MRNNSRCLRLLRLLMPASSSADVGVRVGTKAVHSSQQTAGALRASSYAGTQRPYVVTRVLVGLTDVSHGAPWDGDTTRQKAPRYKKKVSGGLHTHAHARRAAGSTSSLPPTTAVMVFRETGG